jgi:hypothetical protein
VTVSKARDEIRSRGGLRVLAMASFMASSNQAFSVFVTMGSATAAKRDDNFPTAIDLDALMRTFDHPAPTVLDPRRVLVVVSEHDVQMIGHAWNLSRTSGMVVKDKAEMVRLGAGTFSARLSQSFLSVSVAVVLADGRSLVLEGPRGPRGCRAETARWLRAMADGPGPGREEARGLRLALLRHRAQVSDRVRCSRGAATPNELKDPGGRSVRGSGSPGGDGKF